jgi:hypothetical protein
MPLAPVLPRLVLAASAAIWTGHPEGTIRRWGHEGRTTRHRHGRYTYYDLDELPPAEDDGSPGPVPPLPNNRTAAA